MSINIKDYLRRKRSSLEKLISEGDIKNYNELLEYCEARGCDPVLKEEFDLAKPSPVLQKEAVKPKIKKEKEAASNEEKPAKPKRRRSKVSRSTQSSQEKRSSDKTVEGA